MRIGEIYQEKPFGISIEPKCLNLKSHQLDPGNIKLGHNTKFHLEKTQDFDRKIQMKMLDQPNLKKWAVFVGPRDGETSDMFLRKYKRVLQTFNYPVERPKVVHVRSNYAADWISSFKEYLD